MADALPWYWTRFRIQPSTAFVLWQLDAWSLCAQLPLGIKGPLAGYAERCGEFVFEMADWLLHLQLGRSAASHQDMMGGFARPPRMPTCSTAAYTEAIIRAFVIAEQRGDRRRTTQYREASLLGLDFIRRLQITPETAVLFRDPARTVGGTTASLSDMTIRCDYDQHTLTAFLAALRVPILMQR
jgi:hypothetical protein